MRNERSSGEQSLRRRRFLKLSVAALALPALPGGLHGFLQGLSAPDRGLSLFNLHTGESITTEYFKSGSLIPAALAKINRILRDPLNGEIKEIDVGLLDLLSTLARKLETRDPFHVVCGYRSPQTNNFLREHNAGVAANSLHISGRAVDIRIPRRRLSDLKEAALSLRAGGVGYYPRSNFIHVDVGSFRFW